jgi:rhamnosyltransferase
MLARVKSVCSEQCAELYMIEKKNILGIVVTYHPDLSFPERFEGLTGQVDAVLIVDNNSDALAVSMLREMATRLNMDLILNSENLGLAAALNIGVKHAITKGYEWALLYDQDTVPGDEVFEGLRKVYDDFPRKDKLAVIGSNYNEPHTGKLRVSPPVRNGCSWKERRVVISSGSLLSLAIYRVLGPFRDEYFIDCIDLEYCLRARSEGFKVIVASKPLMIHAVGNPTRHSIPWRGIEVSNHSRVRRYYMFRNTVDVAKKYFLREPAWVLLSLWTRFKSILLLCIFEDDKVAKVKYSAMGLFDGLFSKFDRKLS